MRSCGGTDKVILSHQEMFMKRGYTYVYLHPMDRISRFLLPQGYWNVIINGKFTTIGTIDFVIRHIEQYFGRKPVFREIHIHHLKGLRGSDVEEALDRIQVPVKFYIHDYYTICENYNLMKNDQEYCGADGISEQKCQDCRYFASAKVQETRIRNFLKRFSGRIEFIAPSECAKKIWCESFPEYEQQVRVIWHQRLEGRYIQRDGDIHKKLRIAYVGNNIRVKGWDVFRQLVQQNRNREDVEFFSFGRSIDEPFVHSVEISFSNNLNAMLEALRLYQIDCAILWSLWPETYAYTYYECLAANVFVLTNMYSGNIKEQVERRKNGVVCEGSSELFFLFSEQGGLRERIEAFRKRREYGPSVLIENEEITGLTAEQGCGVLPRETSEKRNLFGILARIVYKMYCIVKRC